MMWNSLRWATVSLLAASILSSCNNEDIPGFTKADNGIYFCLHQIGESKQKAGPGDYVTTDIAYATADDSVFFMARRCILVTEPAFPGAIDVCFGMIADGDSATFLISADDFFQKTIESELPPFIAPGSKMKVGIKILKIRSEKEFMKEKEEFLSWIKDFGEYEQTVLKHYIEEEQISFSPAGSGIYARPIVEGSGPCIERGDTVTINYEGRFLNGKIFDSTWKIKEPFSFVYGTEWQVIEGLEEVLGQMCEGDRSIFILPSERAFGQSGSSTGIIPPFTSVVFEVEVLKVK